VELLGVPQQLLDLIQSVNPDGHLMDGPTFAKVDYLTESVGLLE